MLASNAESRMGCEPGSAVTGSTLMQRAERFLQASIECIMMSTSGISGIHMEHYYTS